MNFMPTDHYSAGDVIFEEGYPADSVYYICSGKVKIVKKRLNNETMLAILDEGQIFGEMAFIDSCPRTATVIALEDSWCYKRNKDSFEQQLQELDEPLYGIFQNLVSTIREKSKAQTLIDNTNISSIEEANLDQTLLTPSRSKDELLNDPKIQNKINNLDVFMRTLYENLVNTAFKFPL